MGRHVMLDLETWGIKPGAALRSIGAVVFGLSGGIGAEFYRNIDKHSCLAAGLHIDPETEKWWSRQSREAQAALDLDPRPLDEVAADFSNWFRAEVGEFVWSQGANFDGVLWEHASLAVGRSVPWKFFNTRDTRTAYQICGFNPASMPRAGTYHNALDDAKHQARAIQTALGNAAKRSAAIAEVVR